MSAREVVAAEIANAVAGYSLLPKIKPGEVADRILQALGDYLPEDATADDFTAWCERRGIGVCDGSHTAERDALQRQLDAQERQASVYERILHNLTSDAVVEAAYQAWGASENDMPEAMRVAITAAIEAAKG